VLEVAGIFRSRVIDLSPTTLTLEATGDIEKLDSLLQILRPLAFWGVIRRNALYKRQ
jgi:acetolactate synthase-1/3 small subunit